MSGVQEATAWTALLRGDHRDPPAVVSGVRLVVGAAHRLAWRGPDDDGDRERALTWLRDATAALDSANPGLAAVLDWWMVAALQRDPVGRAWQVDRDVGSPAGDALKRILNSKDGLHAVRRPAQFREVLDELRSLVARNPGNISPAKAIYNQAIDECRRVLRAAESGGQAPTDLRLLREDHDGFEAWASEGSSRAVVPGTPVWSKLVRGLEIRANVVQKALSLWPRAGQRSRSALPTGWESAVHDACGEAADVAVALVQDALADPQARPVLEAATARTLLTTAPKKAVGQAFCLAREAWSDEPEAAPGWVTKRAAAMDEIEEAIDGREYDGEAGEWLRMAAQEASAGKLDEAREYLNNADELHSAATQGASTERQRTHARERAAELTAIGVQVPPETEGVGWFAVVDETWSQARNRIKHDVDAASQGASVFEGSEVSAVHDSLDEARSALDKGRVAAAHTALLQARDALDMVRAADDERLGADLSPLRDRSARWMSWDRAAYARGLDRIVARRTAGLPWEDGARDLRELADGLDHSRNPPTAVCTEQAGPKPTRIAWLVGGVETAGEEARPQGMPFKGVRLSGVVPGDAVQRLSRWAEVVEQPSQSKGGAAVFLREAGDIVGPYTLRGGRPFADHAWGAVAALPAVRFGLLFGLIDAGGGRALVPMPPTLEELVQVGAEVRDALDDDATAQWLATADGAPSPAAIQKWMNAQTALKLPPAVQEARMRRMATLLATSRRLAEQRDAAVAAFLDSAGGQGAIDRAAQAVVEREVDRVREEVERRRADLEDSLKAARAELDEVRNAVTAERTNAAAALEEIRADVAAADELLKDRKMRLLNELGRGQVGSSPAESKAAAPAVTPLRAAGFTPTDTPDLPALIRDVARKTWQPNEVANLLLSIATGRWTLLAGLPGVGKSTFVRSVLSRLGHGPGTERFLELVVRRDWQDDAALFGFWHPTERTWTPSSEGFVEQMLRAADDERLGHGGLWPVLVEELNLASPEYYLARPISAFEAAVPEIRLYDTALEPTNAARYPAAFRVPDSVRLIGTVNVDDTVERLSPRYLSRASVIWIEPQVDAAPWRAEDDVPLHHVRWSALRGLAERAEADLGKVGDVVRFLQQKKLPGAPTVRTQRAIGRYLGASRGLMPPKEAEDLQILQRILPPVRGTGPRWRVLLEELGELLDNNGWKRSAEHTHDLRARGEELGDWYDFFHG